MLEDVGTRKVERVEQKSRRDSRNVFGGKRERASSGTLVDAGKAEDMIEYLRREVLNHVVSLAEGA